MPAPGALGQAPPAGPANERARDPLTTLITTETLSLPTLLLSLLVAFGLGAVHALSPGHGKAMVAAYLVGERGSTRHAVALGLTVTITHTAGVFALGLVTLVLSRLILPERLYPWLGATSGLLVCSIGQGLLWRRLRGLFALELAPRPALALTGWHEHDGDWHDHVHAHEAEHRPGRPGHHHHHGPGGHVHALPGAADGRTTWRDLLTLGVSGGLVPCPSALVVLLGAVALNRVALGLLLIVAVSDGLAAVLTGICLLLVHAGRMMARLPVEGRLRRGLPVVSALLVTLAGLAMIAQALRDAGGV